MTQTEALQMCLEYIETDAHERKYVRHAIKAALANEALERKAENAKELGLDYEPLEAKDEPADNELRRLHDLLGKANALARIRAAEIESLKASLYGHYELEEQYDELKQRLTKTEGQLGEAVWNYGELKREQLANQQKTSGSPINSLTEADKIRNACPRTYNRCGYDAVVKKCVAEGCAGPQNWAVFCGGCGKKWGVPYQHPGKSICAECEAKLHTTPPQRKPLTDAQRRAIIAKLSEADYADGDEWDNALFDAIEVAHGIKVEA
jgi:hypothetical protein